RDDDAAIDVAWIASDEVERDVLDVTEDVHVGGPDAATQLVRNLDAWLGLAHSPMPSSACSRGVLRSATRSRSTSEPRSVTGPRRATSSVAYAKRTSHPPLSSSSNCTSVANCLPFTRCFSVTCSAISAFPNAVVTTHPTLAGAGARNRDYFAPKACGGGI